MSKKTLLNEATVRRFMKLAEIEPLTSTFVNEMYDAPAMADDDEPTPEEAEYDAAYEDEGFEAGLEAGDDDAPGGEDLDVDVDMEDEDISATEAEEGELVLTDEEAEVFLKVAEKVRAAMDAGAEPEEIPPPDMGGDEEADIDAELDVDALGDDLDVEEEEIELEEKNELEEEKQDLIAEEDESLEEDKPYTAKEEAPGADERKGAEKRGAEGTKKKTSGKGRGEKKGDDAYVNEDLVNEIAKRVAEKVLRAQKK